MTETPFELHYPDFLIRCTSHSAAELGSIEAKYRWEGAEWLPASVRGKTNVVVRTLRGNELDDWWSVAVDEGDASGVPLAMRRPKDAAPIREHHEIRCSSRTCRNRIPVPKDSLQWVFMVTTLALRQASKPDRQQWIYDIPRLVAAVDTDRRVVTYTFDGLRAALTYSKAKWGRHTR